MTSIKHILILFCIMVGGLSLSAQESDTTKLVVTGTVFNAGTLEPIGFAAIDNADISSAFSNDDGTFEIEVSSYDNILSVSIAGFQGKEVVLAGKNKVDVYLTPIGYATFQKEADLYYTAPKLAYTTHSITDLSFGNSYENASKTGSLSAETTFKGKASGLEVNSRSGMPGIGSDIFVRGVSSLYGNNRPLIVVDGMIFDDNEYGESLFFGQRKNSLSAIDISDIENISIVKDAVSIYGAKAANGVIYIKTNRATDQSTKIELNMSGGMNMESQNIPMMESGDYSLYLYDMLESTGITNDSIQKLPYMINSKDYADYYKYHNNTDWQKEVFSESYNSNVGLKILGGDDVALYALSVNYAKNEGSIKKTDFSRFSMRFNSDIKINETFTVNSSLGFIRGIQNLRNGTSFTGTDNPYYNALVKAPFLHPNVRTSNGITSPVFEDYDVFGVSNPTSLLSSNNSLDQLSRSFKVFGSINANAKINDNLTISNLVGIMFDKDRESFFVPDAGVITSSNDIGEIYNQNGYRTIKHFAINNDFRAKFSKTFDYIHDFSFIAGARININRVEEDWGTGANTASDQITSVGQGDPAFNNSGGFLSDFNSLTYYALANYGFKKKYFIDASVSVDGATQYGEEVDGLTLGDDVYGVFPSVGAAWLLSSEPFMNNISAIDLLKIRASYGLTGNDNIGLYHKYKYYKGINLLGQYGTVLGGLKNPSIGWEKNTKINLGLDVEFLKSRVSISADVYQNETSNLLERAPASIYSGVGNYSFNNGSFETQGVDVAVNARVLNGKLKWDLGFNVGKYTTEVTDINNNVLETEIYGASVITKVGQSIGAFYGYETNGVYATTAAATESGLVNYLSYNDTEVNFGAGDVIFVDNKKDNIINDEDRVVIGDPTPDFYGGVNTRLKYDRFTLVANASFSVGNDVFNAMRYQLENMQSFNNQTEAVVNRWRYEGQVTDIPKATYNDPMMNSRFSDRWIEDGSYFRLNNVTVSYTLPISVSFMEQPVVFVSGNNLLTLTDYKGLDPDFSIGNSTLTKGIDLGLPSQFRTILIGVSVKL